MSSIHALLMIAPEPLNTEELMAALEISRSRTHAPRAGPGPGRQSAPAQGVITSESTQGLALDDFDGDGDLDVIVGLYDESELAVFLSDGAGRLGPATEFAVNSKPSDLDGDGALDLGVACGSNGNLLRTLRGMGEATVLSEFSGRPGHLGFVLGVDDEQVWFSWVEERGDLWVMDVEEV